MTMEVFIGIGVIVAVIFIFAIIGIVMYRRKSKESGRVMKRMQHQMDALEAKVAKECKEGEKIHSYKSPWAVICAFT